MRSSLYGFTCTSWRGLKHSGISVTKLDFVLTRFRVQCFSARRARSSSQPKPKPEPPVVEEGNPEPPMVEEKNAFYVVRKGDVIGIYRSLSDCQAQVSSSVCDPSVGVYKGYSLRKETEEYLASQGLKNAIYSLNAVDAKKDLFGTLVPCPFTQPDGAASVDNQSPEKTTTQEGSEELDKNSTTYILEFDGASKGNPGKAGAGAVLRTEDGSVVCHLREGLGAVTNNVAEYRALIMGLKYALENGYQRIQVQGDSLLVCRQVNGVWKTKDQNIAALCKEVKGLKKKFASFKISHVLREFNSDADTQANYAVNLPAGELSVECGEV